MLTELHDTQAYQPDDSLHQVKLLTGCLSMSESCCTCELLCLSAEYLPVLSSTAAVFRTSAMHH